MSKENDSLDVLNIIGIVLAMVLSWNVNHSIVFCILHGIINWFYVLYYIIVYLGLLL